MKSMENLRFYTEGYFHVIVSTRYFIKEIENIFPVVLRGHTL